ncbi:pyridoxal-phosphate dependent enzyme [Methyloglobulus sp.]|uniref:1-aminocyclopropane-1-carboxylate deaminase/D-cysteine desulfhydrase n=1 Tax=Methyloglobulus sp. TaxID=2518622 RepID=UPI0032B81D28
MHSELVKIERTFERSALTKIDDPLLEKHDVNLWLKRDDLLHPVISGNKWRKLKYNLNEALSLGADTIISMGGAYSNHLHVLAYVGKILDLKTIGIIRGERPTSLTPTLEDMENWGMDLRFIPRSDYRHYRSYRHWQDLPGLKPNQFWLPEGGATGLALKGVAELVEEIDIPYDTLCVACGTGTTFAGLINAVSKEVSVLGLAALKNADFLQSDVQSLLTGEFHLWEIFHAYHFGGFAKLNPKLALFMTEFEQKTSIPLEPVYTGKMLYGLYDLISKDYFKPGHRVIAIHTGGLQGKRGYV